MPESHQPRPYLAWIFAAVVVGVAIEFVILTYDLSLVPALGLAGAGVLAFSILGNIVLAIRLSESERPIDQTSSLEYQRFADLYEYTPVPYLRVSKVGKVIDSNAAGVRLFSSTKEAMAGIDLFALLSDLPDSTAVLGVVETIAGGQFVNAAEAVLHLPGGDDRIVRISSFPYAHQRERLVTIIDITAEKAVDTAKSEFVSLASHQLRTPISAMRWNLELLLAPETGTLSDAQRGYVEKVARNVEKMSDLVEDFLDAAKLELGRFATAPVETDIVALVAGVAEDFEGRVHEQQQTLTIDLPAGPVLVTTDVALVKMMVTNLISNAVKYTPAGGTIEVGGSVTDRLTITVRDTGIGIPATDLPHLFTKLHRAANAKEAGIEGTGLGLYIVKQAAEYLGGSISVESEENRGTTFTVELPLS